ncbi:MAG: dihydrolipoyl dehydrogenase [Thermodesulfovibrionales bacterium]|nr:dihydrolipoyl dehydrogenase [Thermodesulfovibrionales bacterium]
MRLAVMGAGPGGYVAAIKAAQMGAEVTVIEDREVGGTCLNRGCIPTKTLLASAEAYLKAKELDSFGIELTGEVVPNLKKIMERKGRVVNTLVKGIRGLFKSWGITLIEGRGTLLGAGKIEVRKKDGSTAAVEADKIIIATGSRPAQIPVFPMDGKSILSSDDVLDLTEMPKSLIIIGAGVVGCEFACIFGAFGTAVTMVEMMPRAVSTEDVEISELLEKELKKKKIKLLTGVGVEKVDAREDGVHVFLADGSELTAEKVLVSIGRALNSTGIGLETAGVKTGPKGEITVNNRLETNVDGIYAVGDVTGGILLAHVASTEGITAAMNACGEDERMDYSVVPAAIFTSPEIASVGLREFQAIEKGMKIKTGRFQFRGLGKAHAMGEISGFIKIIADADTDRVVGGHIIGPHSSDLIHEIALAMKSGLRAKDIAGTIHAHPTLSEGIMEAAEDVHGRAVHLPKK